MLASLRGVTGLMICETKSWKLRNDEIGQTKVVDESFNLIGVLDEFFMKFQINLTCLLIGLNQFSVWSATSQSDPLFKENRWTLLCTSKHSYENYETSS